MTLLTRLSLANRMIVGLMGLAIIVFGGIAVTSLRQELLPSTQVPTALVTATYPGTAPELVAEEVATPLEQAISGVSGVQKVQAVSTNGLAVLTVEWTFGLDNDKVVADLRNAADSGAQLPDAVETTVQAGSTDDIPVLVLAVASDAPLPELARQVDEIVVPQISGVDGVRRVQVAGQDVTELRVTLKPKQLRKYDLNAAAVTQAVRGQATVVPAGNAYRGDTELAIQVGTTPRAAKQVANWPIPAPDGAVKLGDIATVEVVSVDATTVARSDGRPALSIAVLKESDADAVEISHAITELLPDLTRTLGSNASINVVFDQAPSIEQSIHDLAIEGALGLSFAVLIILVFLQSIRSTMITAISIPLSLLVALIGLQLGGNSLNIFTLAALTVAVGRVVDDSIVVIENIKRHHTQAGALTPGQIVSSVREVAGAVTASTLTTVAVFAPVSLVEGVTGELFRPFSTTVAVALGASLLVSMTIVPVLAYWFMRSPGRAAATPPGTPAGASAGAAAAPEEDRVTRLQRGYLPMLRLALRRPLITVLVAVLIFAGTMASATLLKTDFLESFADKTTLQVTQELPIGTRLTATSDAARKVEAVLDASPGVKQYLTTVGEGGSNRASMFVSLTGEDAYESTLTELNSGFAELGDAVGEVKVGSINTGTNNDISLTVTGEDAAALESTSARVESMLAGTPGLKEVSSDLSAKRPLLQVKVDRERAADLGFTSAEVGQLIGETLRGTKVGTIVLQGETRDIMVRPQDSGSASPKRIAKLELPVSQLQQQQAVDKATERLKDKQEALKDEGDGLSDRGEALQSDQENLADRQKAEGKRQQRKANAAAADQRAELRKARSKAADAASSARRQLRKLRANAPKRPGPPPSLAPGAGPPLTGDRLAEYLKWQASVAAYSAYQQQVAGAQAGVAQAEAQAKQLGEQLTAASDQAAESAAAQATQDQFGAEQDALGDQQKALSDDQKDLAERQSDLADEQSDIADVRARPIQVGDIAAVEEELSPSAVTQIDGTRAVTITATPDTDDLGAVTARVQQQLTTLDPPAGVTVELGGASEDQAEAFQQLGLAMLLAIVIVFLIMVATFRSLIQPLILLSSIPFAATGAVAGLLITDTALGVPAMVGLLMLIGIVVTNAIVLIDLINQKRHAGEELGSAIVHGARLRLRPIIMTATATIFALLPMGLGLTGGGAFISGPLAIVVIGGLISSTVLTLLLVPALYSLAERRGERRRHRAAEAAAA